MAQVGAMDTLTRLEQTVASRMSADPETSYVASLHAKGLSKMAQKLGEEAVEAAIAAVSGSREELVGESADLLMHLIVLLQAKGISLSDVMAELDRREGTSGLTEKANRSR